MTTPPKIRFSLKYKFICGIALLVGLIIALTSFNTSRREELLLSQSMDQNGLLLVGTLALACQDPMIREAYDELIPYTERVILGGEDIREISIFDLDGKYIAHRVRGDTATRLGETLAQAARDRYDAVERPTRLAMDDAELVEYVAPIKVGSSRFGTIVLQFTFNRLSEAQSTSRRRILLISLVAMLAGVLLSVMLAQFITSGLDQLMKGTQVVSTGDLAYRLSIPSEDEIGMLATRFNDMIGTLEQSRNALDRKIFEIETLFKASQAMNFQNDTDKLVRQILEMAAKALKAERASMMLRVDQTDELVTKIVWGVEGIDPGVPLQSTTRIKSGEGVAGTVLEKQTSIIDNEGCHGSLFKSFDSTVDYEQQIRNLIAVPLKVRDRVTGVINVVNKIEGGFNPDDQRLMEALAQQAAMAVEQARLYELAITDGLTRLFIHRYFQARLEEEILRAKRYHTTVALILFDIDHFKKFNDTYGHQQGDIVLMEVAKILKQTVRDTVDIPARYGGEEFAIILPETDAAGGQLVAERLRRNIEAHGFPGQDKPLHVTISLGIACFPDHASTKQVLIKKSDIALYNCKKIGRNCSSVFNDTMTE